MVMTMSVFVGDAATVVTGDDSSKRQRTTATFLLRCPLPAWFILVYNLIVLGLFSIKKDKDNNCSMFYSSPYFHGQSELMKFSNARPIYFIYWFITVKTAPNNH